MKKNMKKLYSLLLVLALTVSMAAGCGKTEKVQPIVTQRKRKK